MITPKLRSKNAIPYGGGYDLKLPEKGMVGLGTSFTMLLDRIRDWRKANGWPIGLGLEQEVEIEVCRKYSAECDETSESVPRREGFSFQDIVSGTGAALHHWWIGRKLVSQEEADRRALTCSKCDNNIHVSMPCSGPCAELKAFVVRMFGTEEQHTPHDGALKNCAICACWLRAAVWIPNESGRVGLTEMQKAQFQTAKEQFGCWKAE